MLLLGLILGLDLAWIILSGSATPTEFGAIDEPAHLATALLLLLALSSLAERRLSPTFIAAALVASVAIDLDHLPHYLGWDGLTAGTPRPYTHSLLTPALLVLAAELTRRRFRDAALGAAFGVCAHLFRDLATGPGVALLWPFSSAAVGYPYAVFAVGLTLVVVTILARRQAVYRSILKRGTAASS